MTRGVNQVDEEAASIFTLLDERQVVLFQLVVQRDGPERQRGKHETAGDVITCQHHLFVKNTCEGQNGSIKLN